MEAIDDRLKRINLKSKRKRTLLKKIIEMSQLCKLDMLLVIHDAEMNKVIEYNSGSQHLGTLFDLEKASEMVHLARGKKMIHKLLNDDIYKKLLRGQQPSGSKHDSKESYKNDLRFLEDSFDQIRDMPPLVMPLARTSLKVRKAPDVCYESLLT